ncbi:hypothetical protein GB881_19200 [Georgenia subflava]|uniref:Uncharacterized protein n=1 Tax=Georgenia subflava TaxID=1622177 RepID=A0A6N7ERH0_9MICO|nr:hypothetical protein [Georgenia subflava]
MVVGSLAERTGDPASMLAGASGRAPAQAQLQISPQTVHLDRSAGADGPRSTTEAAVAWLTTNGWSAPTELPDAATISQIGIRSSGAGVELVEVEIVRDGDLVRVLEQPGVLDVDALAQLDPSADDGRLVHEIPGPGTTLVLQCEGVVVVVAGGDDDLARQVAAAFPATAPGSDVTDHLDRGWQTLVGWTDLLVQAP